MDGLTLKKNAAAILEYRFATQQTYILGPGYKNIFGYEVMNEYVDNNFREQKIHPADKEHILSETKKFIGDVSPNHHFYPTIILCP